MAGLRYDAVSNEYRKQISYFSTCISEITVQVVLSKFVIMPFLNSKDSHNFSGSIAD